ncbi:tyrosine-protein kinase domain-containing protein [Deinococcus sp. YIM 77859]|uniref:tyrosine-protein kinase domain-containing protein n=1 Tax=Deinococcus sp. YIM 77859 TaxID=1540221 RepID=UPI0005547B3D|nr:tyrosine-protein kinase domain-containing protein [Deinococcus sp. YIM 77859]
MTAYRPPEPATPDLPRQDPENEIDLVTLWQGVRRRLPVILLTAVVLSLAVYLWSRAQPPVYEASSSLITAGSGNVGSLRDTLITAPPLPEGALQEALQGPLVLGEVIRRVRAEPQLTPEVRAEIAADLQKELRERRVKTVTLQSRLDPGGNGIYTVTAQGPTAQAATLLTDITTDALLNWDRGRALQGVQRAQNSLRAQLAEIDRQLAGDDLNPLERQTLIAARATAQRNLAQATIQAEGISGFLERVAPAVPPLEPVAPRPLRNAVLTGLLVLLLGAGIAALQTVLDRTVRTEDDLLTFGLPTLGVIPRLRKRDIIFSGIVRAARQAGLYEAVGFLRVNLLTRLGTRSGQCVMISSTVPGEGKSSVTATLADGLATSGQRVLIVDADLRRGTQQDVWDKYEREHTWHQLSGSGGARTFQDALRDPGNVQVMEAEPNVHVLPAGPGVHDTLGLLNRSDLGDLLRRWSRGYDVVLVDSPPLLALPDGLIVGKHMDAVLLVTEQGKTTLQAVRQALRRARSAGVPVLGFILNKVNVSAQEARSYGYGYSYTPRVKEVR